MEQGKVPALSAVGRWLGAAQEAVSRAACIPFGDCRDSGAGEPRVCSRASLQMK